LAGIAFSFVPFLFKFKEPRFHFQLLIQITIILQSQSFISIGKAKNRMDPCKEALLNPPSVSGWCSTFEKIEGFNLLLNVLIICFWLSLLYSGGTASLGGDGTVTLASYA